MPKGACVALALTVIVAAGLANAEPLPEASSRAGIVTSTMGAQTQEQQARRIRSVETLIEKSSAAKQIEVSAAPVALELRNEARAAYQKALDAHAAGDYAAASKLLDTATKKFFEGVRNADPGQVTAQKKRRDFDNRMESVRALFDALKRINTEKGGKKSDVIAKIESQMQEAAGLTSANNVERGRAVLDQAYVTAKIAIENLRGGDTLVRSLNFATKEEEYHYEIDRNDTHQMLIKVLLEEKLSSGSVDAMVKGFMEKADQLRKEAERLAGRKEFETAIKTLEDSTRELQRALRNSGVYIPG